MKNALLSLLSMVIFLGLTPFGVMAQTEPTANDISDATATQPAFETVEVKAKVTEIISDEIIDGERQMRFVAESDGETYTINTADSLIGGLRYNIKRGDKVFLQVIKSDDGISQVYLADVYRLPALVWILIIFCLTTIIVGLGRGFTSLLGLLATMLVLFGFVFPMIISGHDPVLITVIGSIVILGVNMHLSHGFNRRTFTAYGSTVLGLIMVVIFSELFVHWADLSGYASEEAALLFLKSEQITLPTGLLLAGIILGAVGVLDDITITQTEVVQEIHDVDPKLKRPELFVRAMRVGRHHIASTVNTLVLAYAGVALPLLLLFLITPDINMWHFLNQELIAEEIVRTLSGTMALVLTVPLATWFATLRQKS